eukprot:Phypoly_transcript_21137.p1 GENE.Phypoly_transcript_21137~~Phypoly_transcript_21137.p1  ORF type:complete len:104 (-),score=14.19 Phypoly_transcript_21137:346-636(-)
MGVVNFTRRMLIPVSVDILQQLPKSELLALFQSSTNLNVIPSRNKQTQKMIRNKTKQKIVKRNKKTYDFQVVCHGGRKTIRAAKVVVLHPHGDIID